MGNYVESPDEAQKARADALYEFIANRLGEHDAARNVPDASGSGEYTTMLVTDWSVEDLARFIVDDLDLDLLAPVVTLDEGAERPQVRAALADIDAVITRHQPRELRKVTLAEDVELIVAGRRQARDACEAIAIERDDALADVKALQAVASDERGTTIRVAAQRDRAIDELAELRVRITTACDHPDFRLGSGLLKVNTVRALITYPKENA